jgi:hypothetical protein
MDGLTITVYDKSFARKGWLGSPESVSVTVGFNVVGSASVTFVSSHNRAADILADGARLVIEYEGLDRPLISGPIRRVSGEGPEGQSMITATIEDDLRVLWRVIGWPVPTATIDLQGTAAYRTYTGDAETIVKTMVTEQAVTRLGLPVTVAANQLRGAVVPGGVKVRMHPLADRLFPAVEQAGLGVRCYQQGAGLVLDVYGPSTYPKTLSEQAGTIRSWSYATAAPSVTRAVGGGQGEGTARVFQSATDAARETRFGDVIEVFKDARDAETTEELDKAIDETLVEGKPTSGLSVELSETPYFRYGTVQVGDRVTIQVGGLTITDVLRTATLTWNRQDGLTIMPGVGQHDDSPDARINKAVKALWRGLTNLKVR